MTFSKIILLVSTFLFISATLNLRWKPVLDIPNIKCECDITVLLISVLIPCFWIRHIKSFCATLVQFNSKRVQFISLLFLLCATGINSHHMYDMAALRNHMMIAQMALENNARLEHFTPRDLRTTSFHHRLVNAMRAQPGIPSNYLTKKTLEYAEMTPKEKLSARILEEIESLDALKCLPKALCSISAETASDSHELLKRPTEIKKINDQSMNDYLSVMHKAFTKNPSGHEWAQTERPHKKRPSQTRKGFTTAEESEENSESSEEKEDNEEYYRRPQHFHRIPNPVSQNMNTNMKQKYYNNNRYERPWGQQPQVPPKKDFRQEYHGGSINNGVRRPPTHSDNNPTSYSQQYHYMSIPGPVPSKPSQNHQPSYIYTNDPAHSGFSSVMLYFVPSFVKNIFHSILPSFTFEFTPHHSEIGAHGWPAVVSTPPNMFADDPFFDGFRRGHAQHGSKKFLDFSSGRSRKSGKGRTPVTMTVDDFMIDARDRFVAAIDIGQTFHSLRKCQAIYSTCPFTHTEVISMIEVVKQKLRLQDLLNTESKRRRSHKGKRRKLSRKKGSKRSKGQRHNRR